MAENQLFPTLLLLGDIGGENMLNYLTMIDSEEDKSKFEKLYLTYRQTMFYVANRIIKDEYIAEDIVHQSFLRLINHLTFIIIIELEIRKIN